MKEAQLLSAEKGKDASAVVDDGTAVIGVGGSVGEDDGVRVGGEEDNNNEDVCRTGGEEEEDVKEEAKVMLTAC